MDDQRHAHGFSNYVVSMAPKTAFAQRVSMIGRKNHDAVVIQPAAFQKLDELAETLVHRLDARGIRRIEARIAFAWRHRSAFTVNHRNMNVLRLGVGKHW